MERRAAERSSERDRDAGSNPADPPNVSAGPRQARRPVGVAARGCYFGEAPHRIGAEPPRPEPSCDRRRLFEQENARSRSHLSRSSQPRIHGNGLRPFGALRVRVVRDGSRAFLLLAAKVPAHSLFSRPPGSARDLRRNRRSSAPSNDVRGTDALPDLRTVDVYGMRWPSRPPGACESAPPRARSGERRLAHATAVSSQTARPREIRSSRRARTPVRPSDAKEEQCPPSLATTT